MHQTVAPALGQIDVGDSAVQSMRRVNGKVCGAVELLVAPNMVEFPTIGERLAGLDLELDDSHCTSPSIRWTSLSSIRSPCSPIGGEQKEGPQPEEPKNDKARPSVLCAALRPRLAKSERLSVKLDVADNSYRQHSTTGAREVSGIKTFSDTAG